MDDLISRQIPHSIEAEQAVLGAMLIDSRCVGEVIGIVRSEHFYREINKNIFETIYSMFNFAKPIDPVTVLEEMREGGVYTDDLPAYLRDLLIITPTAANVIEYAWIVRDKALLRGLADAGSEISEMAISGEGGAMSILEAAEQKVYRLRSGRSRAELEDISVTIQDVYKMISDTGKSGVGIPGLTTGFADLDRIILGLNKADLILIASRPGMGKTSIALNIALHVARKSGLTVAVFSLEMSREQLAMRLLSSQSYIDGKKLQTGRVGGEREWQRLADAAALINGAKLKINDDASLTVAEMNSQCRRIPDLGLVVIDYMQLMSAATNERGYRSENRVQIVTEISRTMKVMAKELNVPLICLSQLNRESDKRVGDKRPLLSDLRESGSIEQDADIVMGLYRDDYYNKESEFPNIAECIVLKNRRGETGTVNFRWDPEFTNFSSIDTHRDG